MSKIIFLVQHLGQPRCIKRILSIKDAGFDVEVHGFDRGNYSENISQLTEHGVPIKTIIPSKDLTKKKKVLSYAMLVRKVAKMKAKDDVVYSFGFELTTFTRLLTSVKYVYECADVVAAREHSSWMKYIDLQNIKKACFTVFTSEGFAEYFWGEKRSLPAIRKKYILQPNKISPYFLTLSRPAPHFVSTNLIRFGFVGYFRFLEIYLTFCDLIGQNYPTYEFHFWGDADSSDVLKIRELASKYSNVFYHGSFSNPKDLETVYDTIDVCITCYNTDSDNVKIAEPNKLYESIYFNKPIIVSKGTFLGEKVEQLKVGKAIVPTLHGMKFFLDSITPGEINEMIATESEIDKRNLIDSPEVLCHRLASLFDE